MTTARMVSAPAINVVGFIGAVAWLLGIVPGAGMRLLLAAVVFVAFPATTWLSQQQRQIAYVKHHTPTQN
jgi:hypothetical protein